MWAEPGCRDSEQQRQVGREAQLLCGSLWLLVAPGTCPRRPRLDCPSGSWSLWLLSLCPPYDVGHKYSISLCWHLAATCNFRSVSSSGKILGTQIHPGYGW